MKPPAPMLARFPDRPSLCDLADVAERIGVAPETLEGRKLPDTSWGVHHVEPSTR